MKQFLRITGSGACRCVPVCPYRLQRRLRCSQLYMVCGYHPANLDPQVVSAAPDVIACENLYGGLVRKNADGEIVPNLCESWTVSPDGRTYTFAIKDGLTYTAAKGTATDYSITAEDFVFAFRRIFQAQTGSPYAVEFSAIENSAAVLDGTAAPSTLGVSASGPLTLVFRLSEKDDNFLAKLTLPGAMPCDEEFFNSTRGTYGLTAKTTLSSGSFYLYNWTASGLFLRRDVSAPLIGQPASGAEHRQHRQECRSAHRGREMLCRAGRHRRSDRAAGCFLLRYHLGPAVQQRRGLCL